MIRNYLLLALRGIKKQVFYSAINIIGLAFGVMACLFILLYISDEINYDTFHREPEHIYRIGLQGKIGGQGVNTASSCPPLAAALVAEIPGVEQATRINRRDNLIFKYGEKAFTEKQVLYADSNFFQFFNFSLLEGDPATALKEPNSVVLTLPLALKYFDQENAVGKLLVIGNDQRTYKVTGIVAEPPHQSHFRFTAIISTNSDRDYYNSSIWLNNGLYTYFRKNPGTTEAAVASRLQEVTDKYVAPQIEAFMGTSIQKFRESGGEYSYVPYRLLDSHLRSMWQDEIEPSGNIAYVYTFGVVGVFILIIACINFMNLSTARSAGRAKEVGLRKTLGSFRSQMIGQFLMESFIYAIFSVILAIGLTWVLLPQFNVLAGKALRFDALMSPVFLAGAGLLVVIIGLLAGSYPAFYLTSFHPVEVLKGKVRAGIKSKGIRSGLVVLQFSLSVILITSTLVVYRQINFMQSRNVGMDKHNVLVIRNANRLQPNQTAFKNLLMQKAGVENVSFTNNIFPGVNNTTPFRSASSRKDHIMGTYVADIHHADVLKFKMKEGRFFSMDFPSDTLAVVLNEAAIRELGWERPLEEKLISFNDNAREVPMNVIGVVEDFNFESFKTQVRPLVIRLTTQANALLVRYSGSSAEVITEIEKTWKQYAAGEPFEYSFLDQNYDELFREERRLSQLFLVFTVFTILIACLGLFALAAFTAEQRTKEIGIRKAMGAGVFRITSLLSGEFLMLVVLSIGLAIVPTYYLLDYWLSSFAYRTTVGIDTFIFSGVGAILVALLTVGFQSLKAALAKPVNSLRYE
jgi:putative ABC transport system permease protein